MIKRNARTNKTTTFYPPRRGAARWLAPAQNQERYVQYLTLLLYTGPFDQQAGAPQVSLHGDADLRVDKLLVPAVVYSLPFLFILPVKCLPEVEDVRSVFPLGLFQCGCGPPEYFLGQCRFDWP